MKAILIIIAVVMLAALPVSAQIPRLINYQGVLTDDMGVVVSDGSYSMTFRLYDVPSGGTHLWEETIDVNVIKGIFNTTLGHDEPIIEVFDKPLYLALEIAGGGELSPRRIFTANAYAFSSRAVYGITNVFPAQGNVGIGYATPEAPLHIYTEITDPNTPAFLIQNTGNHSLIDFKRAMVTEARIRYSSSNDFFFGTLTSGGVSLRTNDLTRLRITGPGDVGIGTVGPLEKLDVAGAIRLGTTAENNEGTIRWTGSDFEGYDGSLWHSLTSGGGSGLPSGTSGQTLYHDGMDWAAATNLYNNGTSIGIGTVSPTSPLHVVYSAGQVPLQVDSDDGAWASIYINATNAAGRPNYGYQKQNITRGHHYLDSSFNWNLELDSNPALIVKPNGWASFGSVAVYESLNIPGALKLGMNTNNNPGTIRWTGSDFEGYNGSGWNSFTAGALPSGTTGQTLRYNGGWIADGSLYNNGTYVGIGTTSPAENLHIYEDVDAWVGIEIENPNTGSGSGEQICFNDENGSLAGIRLYDDLFSGVYAGAMAIYNNRPAGSLLFRTGGVNQMRILDTGGYETYGTSGNRGLYSWNNPAGTNFSIYDETGSYPTISLEADGSGEGGFFTVRRNNSLTGFLVDGNNNGSQETEVAIYGSSRSAVFDMNLSGDDSVDLPSDAVSASEMLDEPGAVSATANTTTVIQSSYTVLSSQTITAPAAGYVLVLASSQAQIGHSNGVNSQIDFGVSATDASLPANQDCLYQIPSAAATGTYCMPITSHGLFEVSAGAHTFYYLGRKFADTYNAFSLDKQFTAIFIPTSYGSVMPTLSTAGLDDDAAPRDNGMTSSEISDVRERSLDANNARIEAELAEMRAKIEALQAELDNPNR